MSTWSRHRRQSNIRVSHIEPLPLSCTPTPKEPEDSDLLSRSNSLLTPPSEVKFSAFTSAMTIYNTNSPATLPRVQAATFNPDIRPASCAPLLAFHPQSG